MLTPIKFKDKFGDHAVQDVVHEIRHMRNNIHAGVALRKKFDPRGSRIRTTCGWIKSLTPSRRISSLRYKLASVQFPAIAEDTVHDNRTENIGAVAREALSQ